MGIRRKSRELVMQTLFYIEKSSYNFDDSLNLFCRNFVPSKKILPFFLKLLKGIVSVKSEIDIIIERSSSNWKISRMSGVDRNVMRIAVYEMLYCPDIPINVTINEAIDIGKKYGAKESGAFINGILDSIRLSLEKGEIS